jgi:hypothetical protein
MVTHSYRISQSFGIWRWQVINSDGKIWSEGLADTRQKAAAEAMQTWLNRFEQQGKLKKLNTRGVRY